jgi:hypothetical protein
MYLKKNPWCVKGFAAHSVIAPLHPATDLSVDTIHGISFIYIERLEAKIL